jgi:hypothetical protein
MRYVNTKSNQPDNIKRFIKKFQKDIEYGEKYFPDFTRIFMLWSPIVKDQSVKAKHNQMKDIQEIAKQTKGKTGVDLVLVINNDYQTKLDELRDYAAKQTKELKSPLFRLMQIEEKLKSHLNK